MDFFNGLLGLVATAMVGASAARAGVTEFTSQAAFDAAAPKAGAINFNANGVSTVLPNPSTFGSLSFQDDVTPLDGVTGGVPVMFLVSAHDTPTYGQDFLTFQNESTAITAEIDSKGVDAIGFTYGSYVSVGSSATVTLSTGQSFVITPSSTPQFIGFTSSTPITSVTLDYPDSYALDLLNVSYTPEPSTWAMMILGLGGVGLAMRRRQRALAA